MASHADCASQQQRGSRRSRRLSLQKNSLAVTTIIFAALVIVSIPSARARAAVKLEVTIDVSKAGATMDRNIFGQFAEHLGHGIYDGIWVGPDSPIPNVRGIRKDVVAALRAIKVPNVRWPGGCFADEYHWRNGVGPQRNVTLNPTGAV